MIAARQIAFGRGRGGKRKPYDAEIEYLESTGTQYIDTGIVPNFYTDIYHLELAATKVIPYGCFAGVEEKIGDSMVVLAILRRSASNNFWYVVNKNQATPLMNLNEKHNVTIALDSLGGCKIDDVTFSIGDAYDAPFSIPLALFAFNQVNGSRGNAEARFYRFSVVRNGEKIIDLIPVRVGNVGYMYDKVSGKLFGNSGTGEFVLGADIIDYTAKDYVQDGLVAMWDGFENAGWGIHDASATVWKDLVGGLEGNISASSAWMGDRLHLFGNADGLTTHVLKNLNTEICPIFQPDKDWTWEVCHGIGEYINHPAAQFFRLAQCSYLFYYDSLSRISLSEGVWRTQVIDVSSTKNTFAVTHRANGGYTFYFNGEERLSVEGSEGIGAAISFNIGTNYSDSDFYSVRFDSRALTAEEIAHNYEIDKARFGL